MKTDAMINLDPVQDNDLKDLLNETKETLARDLIQETANGKGKPFSVAKMWNLHKKQRFAVDMIRRLN